MTFPTADQIALAVVTSARLVGESPLAVVRGGARSRARVLAMESLKLAFPEFSWMAVARCCGHAHPRAAQAAVLQAHDRAWWRDDLLDEVVGALVAELYGEQAG